MTEPTGEQPFFESRKPPPGPASQAPFRIATAIVFIACFILRFSGEPADLHPAERTGYFTGVVVFTFVYALIAAGLGALLLSASAARKQKQKTFGEEFGWLFCAALIGGGAASVLGHALSGVIGG